MTSGTTSDNEWHNGWQQMTTSDNEWQRATTNDKEWQRVVQRVTANDYEWPLRLIFLFFQIREEPTTKHPQENSLNLEEDLWFFNWIKSRNKHPRRHINIKKQELQKQLFADFHQNNVLKNFAILTGKHLCWSQESCRSWSPLVY